MAQTHLYSHQQLMNDPTLFQGQVPLIAHGDSWFSFGDFFPTKTRSLLDFLQFGRDAFQARYNDTNTAPSMITTVKKRFQ